MLDFSRAEMTLLRHAMALNPLVTVIPTIHGHFKMVECVVHVEDKIKNKLWERDFFEKANCLSEINSELQIDLEH